MEAILDTSGPTYFFHNFFLGQPIGPNHRDSFIAAIFFWSIQCSCHMICEKKVFFSVTYIIYGISDHVTIRLRFFENLKKETENLKTSACPSMVLNIGQVVDNIKLWFSENKQFSKLIPLLRTYRWGNLGNHVRCELWTIFPSSVSRTYTASHKLV